METIKIRRMGKDGGGIYETEILGEFTLFGERFVLHEVETKLREKGYFGVTHFETHSAVLKECWPDKGEAYRRALEIVDTAGEATVKAKVEKARAYWEEAGQ